MVTTSLSTSNTTFSSRPCPTPISPKVGSFGGFGIKIWRKYGSRGGKMLRCSLHEKIVIVSGAKDRSFIQIYSRTPDPGPKFIKKSDIFLEPASADDVDVGMNEALTNQFQDLKAPIELNPFTSIFDSLKKLVELYFK